MWRRNRKRSVPRAEQETSGHGSGPNRVTSGLAQPGPPPPPTHTHTCANAHTMLKSSCGFRSHTRSCTSCRRERQGRAGGQADAAWSGWARSAPRLPGTALPRHQAPGTSGTSPADPPAPRLPGSVGRGSIPRGTCPTQGWPGAAPQTGAAGWAGRSTGTQSCGGVGGVGVVVGGGRAQAAGGGSGQVDSRARCKHAPAPHGRLTWRAASSTP